MGTKSSEPKPARNLGGRGKMGAEARKYMPRADFPLRPHVATNRWYKTINNRRYYFGPLDDPDAALIRFHHDEPYIRKGLPIPAENADPADSLLTVNKLGQRWMHSIATRPPTEQVAPSTFESYRKAMRMLVDTLGRHTAVSSLTPHDFETLRNAIVRRYSGSPTNANKCRMIIRSAFKWAYDFQLIAVPVQMGTFRPVSQSKVRERRHELGRQTYTAEEVQELLRLARGGVVGQKWKPGQKRVAGVAASPHIEAFILLGINVGMSQKEVADLRWRDLDLDAQLYDSIRPKSKMLRKACLWPETVDAIRRSIEDQATRGRAPLGPRDRVFLTRRGLPWVEEVVKADGRMVRRDSVRLQFGKLLSAADIQLAWANFGKLRATFNTVADGCIDTVAVKIVMGHAPGSRIDEAYNRLDTFDVKRLETVSAFVKAWLDAPLGERGDVIGRVG